MRHEAALAGIEMIVDSAGTGAWHVGNPPDPRAQAEAARHGLDISDYRARQISQQDFSRFDKIIALDKANLADLRAIAPARRRAELSLLLDCVPGLRGKDVRDPYHGGEDDFAAVWEDVATAARCLIANLEGPN